jgi:hypothetical protein
MSKFKVGDRVRFFRDGCLKLETGIITHINRTQPTEYPIEVKWDHSNLTDRFTLDGRYWIWSDDVKLELIEVDSDVVQDADEHVITAPEMRFVPDMSKSAREFLRVQVMVYNQVDEFFKNDKIGAMAVNRRTIKTIERDYLGHKGIFYVRLVDESSGFPCESDDLGALFE